MDPNATIDRIMDQDATVAEVAEAARDLIDWLDNGGFAPDGYHRDTLIDVLNDHIDGIVVHAAGNAWVASIRTNLAAIDDGE